MDKTQFYHSNKIFIEMANFIVDLEVNAHMTRVKILFPFNVHSENVFLHNYVSLPLAKRQDTLSRGISSMNHTHTLLSHSNGYYRLFLHNILLTCMVQVTNISSRSFVRHVSGPTFILQWRSTY